MFPWVQELPTLEHNFPVFPLLCQLEMFPPQKKSSVLGSPLPYKQDLGAFWDAMNGGQWGNLIPSLCGKVTIIMPFPILDILTGRMNTVINHSQQELPPSWLYPETARFSAGLSVACHSIPVSTPLHPHPDSSIL